MSRGLFEHRRVLLRHKQIKTIDSFLKTRSQTVGNLIGKFIGIVSPAGEMRGEQVANLSHKLNETVRKMILTKNSLHAANLLLPKSLRRAVMDSLPADDGKTPA